MLSIGQATTHLGTVTALCTMPPGPCQVVLGCDPASSATAYIGITPGTGGTFSSSNGIPIAAGSSISITGYPSGHGAALSMVTAGTATVGWLVSRG